MSDPSGYILSLIDNKSTISSVAQRSFFSHYRTFEIIFELWQTGTIVPLSNQQSEQITPLTRAQQGKAHESLQVTIAVIMAILFIAIIMCLGFLRSFLTQPIEQPAILRAHEIKQEQLSQKLKIGSLLYHAKIGYAPANPQVLIKEKILDSHDIIATDSL